MKKVIILLLSILMCVLTGCSGGAGGASAKKSSLINVVGVYHGDLYDNKKYYNGTNIHAEDQHLEDFEDLIIVFDYINDDTNRRLPDSNLEPGKIYTGDITCPEITLSINNTNTYEAYDINSYDGHYGNRVVRYSKLGYAVGYGNVLGGADPIRMFVIFYVNPNDIKEDAKAVFTLGEEVVEINLADTVDVTTPDEILQCGDYEKDYQLAAFRWRLDHGFYWTHFLTKTNIVKFDKVSGSDFSLVAECLSETFDNKYSFTCGTHPGIGKGSKDPEPRYSFSHLPKLDLDIVTSEYPEIKSTLDDYIDHLNTLSEIIVKTGTSKSTIQAMIEETYNLYYELAREVDLEPYEF